MNSIITPNTDSLELNQIINEVFGANNFVTVEKNFQYYAYKNGNVLGMFNTLSEAEKHSKITERVCTNFEEYQENVKLEKRLRELARTLLAHNVLSEIGKVNSDENISVMRSMLENQNYETGTIIDLAYYFNQFHN